VRSARIQWSEWNLVVDEAEFVFEVIEQTIVVDDAEGRFAEVPLVACYDGVCLLGDGGVIYARVIEVSPIRAQSAVDLVPRKRMDAQMLAQLDNLRSSAFGTTSRR